MRKIIYLLAILFILPCLVSANLGCFKQNEPVSIRVLANCSSINLTEVTILNKAYVINSPMTHIGGQTFNYTFFNATDLGEYSFSWNNPCVDCSKGDCGNSFTVTHSGLCQTTSQGIGSAVYLFLTIVMTFLFGLLGLRFLGSKEIRTWIIGLFLSFFSLLFLIYDLWLGYEYYITFTGMDNARMPETMFYIFLFIILASFAISLTLLFLNWKKVFKYFKRELKRKDNDQDEDIEDWDLDKYYGSQKIRR